MTKKESQDQKSIVSQLKIARIDQPTTIILLVIHNDFIKNDVTRLQCKNMLAMAGYPKESKLSPLGGYVYDAVNDCYLVNCIDHVFIGVIPCAFKATMPTVGNWSAFVPAPEALFRKLLDEKAIYTMDNCRAKYTGSEFDFQFIQFLNC